MGNDSPKFNRETLKSNLKMATSRFTILKNKRINLNHGYREEIAKLLRQGNEELARIKVEAVINNENYMAAVDILSMMCQICSERIRVIVESGEPPADVRYAIETLIWAASRSDCPEMLKIRDQFYAKYGEVRCRGALRNEENLVNTVVVAKLEATMPDEELKIVKLKEIAAEKMVEYVPGGEALRHLNDLMPRFPSSDIYSQSADDNYSIASVPSAPDMGYPDHSAVQPGEEKFYPRLSTYKDPQSYDLPPPVFPPPSAANPTSPGLQGPPSQYGGLPGLQGPPSQYGGTPGGQGPPSQYGGTHGVQGPPSQYGGSPGIQGPPSQYGTTPGGIQGPPAQYGSSLAPQSPPAQYGGSPDMPVSPTQYGSAPVKRGPPPPTKSPNTTAPVPQPPKQATNPTPTSDYDSLMDRFSKLKGN